MDLLGDREAKRLRAGQWRQRLSDWINAHPGEDPPAYLQRMAETELGMERGGLGASFATQAFDTSAQREQAAATTRKTRAEADVEEARAATGQEALKEIKRKAQEKAAPTATTTPALDREIEAFRRRWNLNEGEYPTDYGAKQALQTLEQRRADMAQEQYDENQKNALKKLENEAKYYESQQRTQREGVRGEYGVKRAETTGEYGVKREGVRGQAGIDEQRVRNTGAEAVAQIRAKVQGGKKEKQAEYYDKAGNLIPGYEYAGEGIPPVSLGPLATQKAEYESKAPERAKEEAARKIKEAKRLEKDLADVYETGRGNSVSDEKIREMILKSPEGQALGLTEEYLIRFENAHRIRKFGGK